ncbi:hypothetical protein IW261DRAFT_1422764 [Armillaria novae-zelandiae]|uniref:Uncharacterized protein n=1 Tax=Armillaria novae-zelandiae TaxID=153914 RepID=A0AA39UDQ3_9AGAR|nr:hypothetical protein IW261DRAFT_1422764 [Armillaria novae-zelandiae]
MSEPTKARGKTFFTPVWHVNVFEDIILENDSIAKPKKAYCNLEFESPDLRGVGFVGVCHRKAQFLGYAEVDDRDCTRPEEAEQLVQPNLKVFQRDTPERLELENGNEDTLDRKNILPPQTAEGYVDAAEAYMRILAEARSHLRVESEVRRGGQKAMKGMAWACFQWERFWRRLEKDVRKDVSLAGFLPWAGNERTGLQCRKIFLQLRAAAGGDDLEQIRGSWDGKSNEDCSPLLAKKKTKARSFSSAWGRRQGPISVLSSPRPPESPRRRDSLDFGSKASGQKNFSRGRNTLMADFFGVRRPWYPNHCSSIAIVAGVRFHPLFVGVHTWSLNEDPAVKGLDIVQFISLV